MPTPASATPSSFHANAEPTIIDGCDKLVDFQAWSRTKIFPDRWLTNFEEKERPFAVYLLSKFIFFSDALTDQLFISAYQGISNFLPGEWQSIDRQRAKWNHFLNSALITIVQGENPNPSDSGWLFARKARKVLGVDQDNLCEPIFALNAAMQGFRGPIVFVDDFVGSGQQFITSWHRKQPLQKGKPVSFAEAAANLPNVFIYCNAVATEYGISKIKAICPNVIISSGNVLPNKYSWVSVESMLWPDSMRSAGLQFIRSASMKAGMPDCNGGEGDWRGFHKLGLGLAFEHSVPDATLPLFTSEERGWQALVRIT